MAIVDVSNRPWVVEIVPDNVVAEFTDESLTVVVPNGTPLVEFRCCEAGEGGGGIAEIPYATRAETDAGVLLDKVLNPDVGAYAYDRFRWPGQHEAGKGTATVGLVDEATITVDGEESNVFSVTLTANRTLAAPTNPINGQVIKLRFKQDEVGGWTITWPANFRFIMDTEPELSTAPGAVDVLYAGYDENDEVWECSFLPDLTGTGTGWGVLPPGPPGPAGSDGLPGPAGPTGPAGTPAGGLTGQVLTKITDDDYDVDWQSIGGLELSNLGDVDVTGIVDGDALVWDSVSSTWLPGAAGDTSTDEIWVAKGDLAVGTALATAIRLAVGTDGHILSANASEPTGLEWITPPAGGSATISYAGGGGSANQASDLVITSNASFQDTDLSIYLEPGSYAIEGYYTTSVNATPDMEVQADYSGTMTTFAMWRDAGRSGATSEAFYNTLPAVYLMNDTAVFGVGLRGIITVSTAGYFTLEARQVTSSGTSVTFHEGSWLRLTPTGDIGIGTGGLVGSAILGAPGTTLSVTGLDLAADRCYFVELVLDNQSGSNMAVGTVFNNDTTATNYDNERRGSNGSSEGSAGANSNLWITGVTTGLPITATATVQHNFDGKPVMLGRETVMDPTNRGMGEWAVTHRTTANVTRIDFVSSVNMATGSYVRIWRMAGGAPSAAAQVGFDNSSSTLNAMTVQAAILELESMISNKDLEMKYAAQENDLVLGSQASFTDTDCQLSLGVGTWYIETDHTVTSHATPDCETQLDFTGTITSVSGQAPRIRGSTITSVGIITALPYVQTETTTDVIWRRHLLKIVVSVAGILKWQIRQVTSSATTITYHAGSYIRARGGDSFPVGTTYEQPQATDLVITTNAVYQDTALSWTLPGAGTYKFSGVLFLQCHATPDMNVQLNYTGTVTRARSGVNIHNTGTSSAFMNYSATLPHAVGMTSTAAYVVYWEATVTVSTGGVLSIQAKQSVSSGTAVTFEAESRGSVGRLA